MPRVPPVLSLFVSLLAAGSATAQEVELSPVELIDLARQRNTWCFDYDAATHSCGLVWQVTVDNFARMIANVVMASREQEQSMKLSVPLAFRWDSRGFCADLSTSELAGIKLYYTDNPQAVIGAGDREIEAERRQRLLEESPLFRRQQQHTVCWQATRLVEEESALILRLPSNDSRLQGKTFAASQAADLTLRSLEDE